MGAQHPSEVSELVQPFAAAMADPGSTLAEMALAVSQALQPRLDPMITEVELDELAARVESPTREGVLRELLGSDDHLRPDRGDYHHWRNSCLDQVVARRAGMPITLAIAVIEVARRRGVDLVGVGLPGHFLVGDPTDSDWFADPFHGVASMDRSDATQLFTRLGGTRFLDQYLTPIPDRLVIARVLNNLVATTKGRNDRARLAIVMQLRQELPEFVEEHQAAIAALAVFN